MSHRIFSAGLFSAISLGLSFPLSAGLIVYEPYDYPAESAVPDGASSSRAQMSLPVSEGGAGLSYPDKLPSDQPALRVSPEGLEYADQAGKPLLTKGLAAILPEGSTTPFFPSPASLELFNRLRDPANPLELNQPGSEVWFSYLMQISGPTNPAQVAAIKFSGQDTGLPIGLMGHKEAMLTFISMSTKVKLEDQATYLVVGKITHGEPNTFELWVNPEVGAAAPLRPPNITATDIPLSLRSFWFTKKDAADLKVVFDEIRIGESYADVTPARP